MYANKIDNLDVMGNFLERYRLLKLTQIKSKDLNRSITINFISYQKKFSQSLGLDSFSGEFYQTFKEKIMIMPHDSSPKKEDEGACLLWGQY